MTAPLPPWASAPAGGPFAGAPYGATVSIDPQAMRIAVPAVEQLRLLLDDVARRLADVDPPAGVPAPVAAQVGRALIALAGRLRAAARDLDAIPDELLRRISAAQLAESPALQAAGWTLPALAGYARSFSMANLTPSIAAGMAARDVAAGLRAGQHYAGAGPRGAWGAWRLGTAAAVDATAGAGGVPAGLARGARFAGRGVTWLGWGVTAWTNARNPYLTTGQKVARTGAAVATGAGVSILAGAAAGAAFGSAAGPLGTLVGFGAGSAWAFADSQLHVSDAIGDAVADAGDAVSDAASSVASKALGALGL